MITHKSIAQATLKGKIRVAADHESGIIQSMNDASFNKPLWGHKKGVIKYINGFRDMAKERLIHEQTSPKRTSWHFKHEHLFLDKKLFTIGAHPELGPCLGMFLYLFDTRKMMKGKDEAHQMYGSTIFFQEHFLVRFLSRVGTQSLGEIGIKIYPVIHWLAVENVPYKHIPKDGYFVFPEFVLVFHMIPNSEGLLFKTVLMRENMDEGQATFFSSAYKCIDSDDAGVVLINEKGDIVRKVFKQGRPQFLSGIDFKSSNWFFDMNEQYQKDKDQQMEE